MSRSKLPAWEDQPLPASFPPPPPPPSIEEIVSDRDGDTCRLCWKGGASSLARVKDESSPSDDPELIMVRACWGCAQHVKHVWASLNAGGEERLIRDYRMVMTLMDLLYQQNCSHQTTIPFRGGRR